MERGVLLGAAALRAAALAFALAISVAAWDRLQRPALAAVLLGLVTAWAVVAARLAVRAWRTAVAPAAVAIELALVGALVTGDGLVLQGRATGQQLAGAVPIATLLVSGVAGGPLLGATAGAVLGLARLAGTALAGVPEDRVGRELLSTASSAVIWIIVGAVVGWTCRAVRRAEEELADARARARVAADLHDGVLQALAVVERRSGDPEVVGVARAAARDLRSYLVGARQPADGLEAALRRTADGVAARWGGLRVSVTVTPDAEAGPATAAAAAALVGEALTNAAKHGGAASAVVLADLDDASGGLVVSVRDDGCGFDPAATPQGSGLRGSVHGRAESVGGRAEVTSAPGQGCEVRVLVPSPAHRR